MHAYQWWSTIHLLVEEVTIGSLRRPVSYQGGQAGAGFHFKVLIFGGRRCLGQTTARSDAIFSSQHLRGHLVMPHVSLMVPSTLGKWSWRTGRCLESELTMLAEEVVPRGEDGEVGPGRELLRPQVTTSYYNYAERAEF